MGDAVIHAVEIVVLRSMPSGERRPLVLLDVTAAVAAGGRLENTAEKASADVPRPEVAVVAATEKTHIVATIAAARDGTKA